MNNMTMAAKSKTKTAVGLVAACAAASTSTLPRTAASSPLPSSLPTPARTASAVPTRSRQPLRPQITTSSIDATTCSSLLNRIPRGGQSSTSPAEAVNKNSSSTKEGEKKRKKKKKRPKQQTKSSSATASSAKSNQQQHQHGDDASAQNNAPNSSSKTSTTNNDNDSSSNSSPLPPAAQSILSQSCHYDVLGITNTATQNEIQKAYRRRCVLTHPDKTRGDRSAFDKVSEAYDVLSCERKRAVYDRFGKEGLDGGGMGMDATTTNGMRKGGFGGSSFFGNDAFREFFGAADPFSGRRGANNAQNNPFARQQQQQPRNRDLRYQLEVTLEELYNGATKHVAIQQPNPLRPHFPLRKEVEVTLTPGMSNGQSVRLSGVVDSMPDAAPADVVFLVRERRHGTYTRRGCDLAMEVKISFGESIVGFRRGVECLDGRTIVVESPTVKRVVTKEEIVDAPALPVEEEEVITLSASNSGNGNSTNPTSNASKEETPSTPERITKTTTLTYHLPPSIIQTGDVHILKGHGMPKRGGHNEYGDLYLQYVVETPASSSSPSSNANVENLSPEERVELAHLLSKLEGADDPTRNVVRASSSNVEGDVGAKEEASVHALEMASASDFGSSVDSQPDHDDDDDHMGHGDDDPRRRMPHGFGSTEDVGDFFQRAFGGGRSHGFGGGSGFHYFSSGGGGGQGGYGYHGGGREEEDHKVECNQM